MHTPEPAAPRPPLEGIVVLDVGTVIAAPFTAALLADWGADVVKIEHPSGDGLRRTGPSKNGAALTYKFYGRNKRNIVLDLSAPQGQEVMRGLAAKADVLVENFRPGVMERWGLGWEPLHALNPRLVMTRISGFGQTGPYATRPCFGTLAEAMSGYAHINGHPDGPPTLPPFGLADGVAALNAAYATLLALYQRDAQGRGTGQGQMIDVALIEPIYHILGYQTTLYDQLGIIQQRTGNRSANNAPRNAYRTSDGRWVAMSTASQSIAERVMALIGRPEVAREPWFRTGNGRAAHGDELDAMVADWVRERDLETVMRAFEEAGAAIAPIYDIEQLMADAGYRARGSVAEVADEDLGRVKMQNLPFRMSGGRGEVKFGGRRMGRDTEEVLREKLGLSDEQLRALYEDGVTRPASEPREAT